MEGLQMVAYLPQYCGIVRQTCDEGDKTVKKANQKHRRRLQTFKWQIQMRRLWTKTRPCRHCATPLIPGSFWGRHTLCKGCHTVQRNLAAKKRRYKRPAMCRTCHSVIEPGCEYHIQWRRICKECKHAYEGKRYAHMMSAKPPTWLASEAYTTRSLKLAVAMINIETGEGPLSQWTS